MKQGDKIQKASVFCVPRDRVWRAISDAKHYCAWMGLTENGAFAPGVTYKSTMAPTKFNAEFAALQEPFRGLPVSKVIDRMDAMDVFSFRFHPFAVDRSVDYSDEPMNLVVFELSDVPGGTQLSITESGFDRIPTERRPLAQEVNDKGWSLALKSLERYLDTFE